jgi:tetratricopeptide (TPR) repeat protein
MSEPKTAVKVEVKAKAVSTRAFTTGYIYASVVSTFVGAYLLYIDRNLFALAAAVAAFIVIPILALTDRVVFDGRRIGRTGPLWRLLKKVTGLPRKVKPRAVVHVETEAIRAFRRGPNVKYLYRTTIHTSDIAFCIASGSGFREMIAEVLPRVPDGCLDLRSLELRDHLADQWKVEAEARSLQIPRSDVLDAAAILEKRGRRTLPVEPIDAGDMLKAEELRRVANKLRTSGKLLQALEAFRRALRLSPRDGRLLYEVGRCLQSFAAAKRDTRLDRKAHAILRLAERHSSGDGDLLSRLGETYFAAGYWSRAERVFKKAVDAGSAGFRVFRGLGELALRDGKIAHAINHFARSAEAAKPAPLFRWAMSESDYLRRLNDDEEYMELEIGRINLFDTFEGVRRTSRRIFAFGLIMIPSGLIVSPIVTDIGWAVSGVSLLIWLAATILKQFFAARIPFDLLEKD